MIPATGRESCIDGSLDTMLEPPTLTKRTDQIKLDVQNPYKPFSSLETTHVNSKTLQQDIFTT
jgi:hypothetical protein